jgi:hypothetical protein
MAYCGVVVSTPVSYSGVPGFDHLPGDITVWAEIVVFSTRHSSRTRKFLILLYRSKIIFNANKYGKINA